jgi:hypothetical protein
MSLYTVPINSEEDRQKFISDSVMYNQMGFFDAINGLPNKLDKIDSVVFRHIYIQGWIMTGRKLFEEKTENE